MTSAKYFALSAAILSAASLSLQATAHRNYFIYPSICEGLSPSHAKKLVFSDLGLMNKHSSKAAWVSCTYVQDYFVDINTQEYLPQSASFGFSVASDSAGTKKFTCFLKAVETDSSTISSRSKTLSISGGTSGDFHNWDLPRTTAIAFRLECKIPPGGILTSIYAASSGEL